MRKSSLIGLSKMYLMSTKDMPKRGLGENFFSTRRENVPQGNIVRDARIELAPPAWEAEVLPLN